MYVWCHNRALYDMKGERCHICMQVLIKVPDNVTEFLMFLGV